MAVEAAISRFDLHCQMMMLAAFMHKVNIGHNILVKFLEGPYRGWSAGTVVEMFGMCAVFITLLEIPTGILGDLWGPKRSIMIAYAAHAASMAMYAVMPNLAVFALAVFIEAVGHACLSGSESVLLRGLCEEYAKASLGSSSSMSVQSADKLFYEQLAQLKKCQSLALMLGGVLTVLLQLSSLVEQPRMYDHVFIFLHVVMNMMAFAAYSFLPGDLTYGGSKHAMSVKCKKDFWRTWCFSVSQLIHLWSSLSSAVRYWLMEAGIWSSVPYLLIYFVCEPLLPAGLGRVFVACGQWFGSQIAKRYAQRSQILVPKLPLFARTYFLLMIFVGTLGVVLLIVQRTKPSEKLRVLGLGSMLWILPSIQTMAAIEVETRTTQEVQHDTNTVLNISGMFMGVQFAICAYGTGQYMDKDKEDHGICLSTYAILVAVFACMGMSIYSWIKEGVPSTGSGFQEGPTKREIDNVEERAISHRVRQCAAEQELTKTCKPSKMVLNQKVNKCNGGNDDEEVTVEESDRLSNEPSARPRRSARLRFRHKASLARQVSGQAA